MQIISLSIWIYVLSIIFAMLIATLIKGMAVVIEKLGLDRGGQDADLAIPSANSAKEEEALAVAIAVAHSKNR